MAVTIVKCNLKDGRSYDATADGLANLRRTYQLVLAAIPGANDELTADRIAAAGVPALGSAHPADGSLVVDSYRVKEGSGSAKATVDVEVAYTRTATTTDAGEGEEADDVEAVVERWGWDAGTEQRELVTAADGTPVLNSAGDVFDRAPMIDAPSPTFSKVIRTARRMDGWDTYNCKVNEDAVTIGGVSYAPQTLRCQICEERVLDSAAYPYRYSVSFKFRSCRAKVNGGDTLTECGWDTVVTDAGMRQKDADGNMVLITVADEKTGEPVTVTSPELLNGNGSAVVRSATSGTPAPYNIRFQAYERVKFPAWMTSEPTLSGEGGGAE